MIIIQTKFNARGYAMQDVYVDTRAKHPLVDESETPNIMWQHALENVEEPFEEVEEDIEGITLRQTIR